MISLEIQTCVLPKIMNCLFQTACPRRQSPSRRTRRLSIHAPAQGATIEHLPLFGCHFYLSIHAPAQGATKARTLDGTIEGSLSIHAPAQGATIANYKPGMDLGLSIHAPAQGATVCCAPPEVIIVLSIHAPAQGATEAVKLIVNISNLSIHAPAQGATPIFNDVRELTKHFQSTHPRRVRLCPFANFAPVI